MARAKNDAAAPARATVTLAHHWTDPDGTNYVPGDDVEMDAGLAASLVDAAYAAYATAKDESAATDALST